MMNKRDKTRKEESDHLGMGKKKKRKSDGDRISAAPIVKVREDSNGWKRSKREVGG